ncbi:MAG TPA: UGSC family (seleno)protein, partial [Acetobacteraceae bacterium]|nr:UGSC family (seleno)protein [Acetobacteraceae bacterium]
MVTVLLDPTSEQSPTLRERLPRPERLRGLTVGLLDISKPRGDVFLDRLDARLTELGITVKRYMKPTVARPAPLPLRRQIVGEVNVVIEGL